MNTPRPIIASEEISGERASRPRSSRAMLNDLLRRRTEEWQAATRQNAHMEKQLEHRRRQIEAMYRISEAVFEKLDADAMASRTLSVALEVLGAQTGSLQLYDAENDTLVFKCVIGPGSETITGYAMPAAQGISGQVLRTGVPDVTSHVRQHGGFNPMLRGQSPQAATPTHAETMATVPLKRPTGDAIGVLQLVTIAQDGFGREDVEVLQVLCAQLAAAIETTRLAQQARQAEIVGIIGDISHDIKNMLTPIQSGLWTLQPMLKDHFTELEGIRQRCYGRAAATEIENSADLARDTYQWIFEGALEACERVEARTREIADAVKGEIAAPFFELSDLNQTAREVALPLFMVAEKTNVHLHLELDHTLPLCEFDRKQMYSALYNLVNNAIPATPSGQSVTIRTRGPAPGESTALLEVEDTGRGMPEHVRARLFTDAAISTKVGGTGLGTRIVAGVVRRHHGHLTVESKEGHGSKFSIRLPLRYQENERGDTGEWMQSQRLPARRDNLPSGLGTLIGRERQRQEAITLLKSVDTRLLIFSGMGGIGKTRLAVQVAHDLRDEFADGAWFVSLAPLDDPSLTAFSVAAALGVREEPGRPLLENLTDYLRSRQLLLVLDNFEQITEAAPLVQALVQQCPQLRVLITSRSPLHLPGERELSLQPLQLPGVGRVSPARAPSRAEITKWKRSAAVALFIERARGVQPDFALTPNNARDVAEICTQLDGLPLAIELAAARIKVLSPQAMHARLHNRLELLHHEASTAGAVEMPARHQTLRAAIDWSYELLDASGQTLLRRLMVFDGGCIAAAARAVCGDEGLDVEASLSQLVDGNLLRQTRHSKREAWYWALETIREYGREKLEAAGEIAAMHQRHATYYLALAESARGERTRAPEAPPRMSGVPLSAASDAEWSAWRKREDDNLRAALRWFLDHPDAGVASEDEESSFPALRMALALRDVWVGNYWNERREALRRALEQSPDAPDTMRLLAMLYIGDLANLQADTELAEEFGRQSLEISARNNDPWGRARALSILGNVALAKDDLAAARAFHEESLSLAYQHESEGSISWGLYRLGTVALRAHDAAAARDFFEQSLEAFRRHGDKAGLGWALYQLGQSDYQRSDAASASRRLGESLSIFRDVENVNGIAWTLCFLGKMDVQAGEWAPARVRLTESLELSRRLGDRRGIAAALGYLADVSLAEGDFDSAREALRESTATWQAVTDAANLRELLPGFTALAVAQGQMEPAARLLGAIAALNESQLQATNLSVDRDDIWQRREAILARGVMGEVAFASAWEKGQGLTLEQAIDEAFAL